MLIYPRLPPKAVVVCERAWTALWIRMRMGGGAAPIANHSKTRGCYLMRAPSRAICHLPALPTEVSEEQEQEQESQEQGERGAPRPRPRRDRVISSTQHLALALPSWGP